MLFRRVAIVVLLSQALAACAAGADKSNCFAPFLTDQPPEIVETVARETVEGVEVTRFKFLSRTIPVTGEQVIIYAVMARPTRRGPHPAILVCHGGGGYADMVAGAVIGWAKRGYVAICQDQPGFCNRANARSSGPCLEAGANAFHIHSSPDDSALFDGVAAALNSLALLRSQDDVDRNRVGVFGGSWGGYMTTMIASLAGDRVRAAYSVYGCGFFDVGSGFIPALESLTPERRAIWLEHLDAGRRAHGLTAAYFVPSPANDWHFWPSAVMRTLEEIPGETNYCFMPNDSHVLTQPGGTSGPPPVNHRENRTHMEIVWFEYHLQGTGQPFPRATAAGEPTREGPAVRVTFDVQAPSPIGKSTVWYAAGELPWRMKWWAPAPAKQVIGHDGRYTAVVPVDEPGQPLAWFAVVSDERHVSVSTLIHTLDPASLGFRSAGSPATRFVQGFEDPNERRRWGRKYADRNPGRHRICAEAARSGEFGLELKGESTFVCSGLRGASLKRSGAKGLRLWMRAADAECPMPTIDLQAELPNGQRIQWVWTTAPEAPLTTEWRAVEIPFDDLEYAGAEAPPIELLAEALGQLRLITCAETHLYLDDVESF